MSLISTTNSSHASSFASGFNVQIALRSLRRQSGCNDSMVPRKTVYFAYCVSLGLLFCCAWAGCYVCGACGEILSTDEMFMITIQELMPPA